MSSHDTIVIGAGLAGLRCATRLADAGRDVVVLEAGDAVGGRERTDLVDGFRLDRGFHVLNPAYPAVQRAVDIDALDLRRFPVAVGVRLGGFTDRAEQEPSSGNPRTPAGPTDAAEQGPSSGDPRTPAGSTDAAEQEPSRSRDPRTPAGPTDAAEQEPSSGNPPTRATVAHLAHPLRHPGRIIETLRSGLVRPGDLVALARWAAPAILAPQAATRGPDRPLSEGWDRAGLRGPLRESVLEPFLAGVIADDRQQTSDAFVRLLIRSFALGRPGLPADGIGALPAQLAATARRAGAGIRLSHRVTEVQRTGRSWRVEIEGGDAVSARTVVFATGLAAPIAGLDLAPPRTRGLQTWWFATDEAPSDDAALRVDGRLLPAGGTGRRPGPVVNTSVLTRTVPSYAPAGQHLVHATCLLPGTDGPATEADVRRQLADLWDADVAAWRLLRRDDIPDALPAQDPPLRARRPVRLGDGRYVAGDHRDTASIQGALVSGERTARAVLADQVR
ncbi:FAD-dependent oxidoreductase [Microbacterium sp. LMI1-1-1.1]|uniref:FAD-dependent oxidoreductase n=1 Tax=Microbacterium sp. LMI1-1-1.1 TaxID=3135223 RepID=UPI0034676B0A